MPPTHKARTESGWRKTFFKVIFESDTPAGKAFDVALIWAIVISVAAVLLESVVSVRADFGTSLYIIEWFFTLLFTVEYIFRLICVGRPLRYARSFFGIVDLMAIVPTIRSQYCIYSTGLLSAYRLEDDFHSQGWDIATANLNVVL